MVQRDRHLVLFVALLIVPLSSGCGESRSSEPDAAVRDASSADASERSSDEAAGDVPLAPAYDEEGVPRPHPRKLALGTPIPQGFERLHKNRGETVYKGRIPVEKVYRFYQRYLDCAEVFEGSRGWQFKRATPREPGDTSRTVEVAVLKRSRRSSQIIVIDRMGRVNAKAPQGKLRNHEELYKAAHKGVGSVREPIPGTY